MDTEQDGLAPRSQPLHRSGCVSCPRRFPSFWKYSAHPVLPHPQEDFCVPPASVRASSGNFLSQLIPLTQNSPISHLSEQLPRAVRAGLGLTRYLAHRCLPVDTGGMNEWMRKEPSLAPLPSPVLGLFIPWLNTWGSHLGRSGSPQTGQAVAQD